VNVFIYNVVGWFLIENACQLKNNSIQTWKDLKPNDKLHLIGLVRDAVASFANPKTFKKHQA
jgi:hypothetical protein